MKIRAVRNIAATFLFFGSAGAAFADCFTRGANWYISQGGNYAFTDTISNGTRCRHPSVAGSKNTFTSVEVVSPPKNGTFDIHGLQGFYTPKKDFKGTDRYSIKVCGTDPGGAGCITATYDVIVQ